MQLQLHCLESLIHFTFWGSQNGKKIQVPKLATSSLQCIDSYHWLIQMGTVPKKMHQKHNRDTCNAVIICIPKCPHEVVPRSWCLHNLVPGGPSQPKCRTTQFRCVQENLHATSKMIAAWGIYPKNVNIESQPLTSHTKYKISFMTFRVLSCAGK